jgi:membrane protease subunit (stomatin/prohibitin family)
MALFHNQTANVVEWEEYRDDVLFWKWKNTEIKKGSRLILRQGQDAIFMANGRVEGVFRDEGSYDIESEIIPFLSTLKGFRFGFQSGLRAEVLFVNTKEIPMKWGTKNPISIPAPGLPGGMPIRAYGTYQCRVADEMVLIEKIAGIKKQFLVEEVKDRVDSMLSQLLMKWISKEGKDMFHLQSNAYDISKGICQDLDMEMQKIGIGITDFTIASVSYPEEVAAMQKKAAAQSMVGDVNRYTQINMADSIGKGGNSGNVASSMAQMQMGMMMGKQMADQMTENGNQAGTTGASGMNFCPNCGTKTDGAKFCPNCGTKLS